MEKFVDELKKLVPFKDSTVAGDIVLLASHEPRMVVYAVVKSIEPDKGRKQSWWNVTMLVLSVPPQEVVWTLREPQFTGQETFSFGGIDHFMKAIRLESSPSSSSPPEKENNKETGSSRGKLRVVK